MSEERYKEIKDSIELQNLVKVQIGVEDELLQEEIELLKAYEKLKDNWNKLKEHLHNADVVIDYSENYDGRFINYDELVKKMQELELGSDNK